MNKKLLIAVSSAILVFLLSSCTTNVCVRSHEETVPAGYRYGCGIGLGGTNQFCGFKFFFEEKKQVCDAYETKELR